jgi:serine/threonine protein kinase
LTFKYLLDKLSYEYKSTVTVKYIDEEGDIVTIRSDDELCEFFDYFTKLNKLCRLDVHVQMIKNDKSGFKWQQGDLLGTGAYGKVFMAINLSNGEFMAVKQVPLKGTQEKRAKILSELVNEINLMKQFKHENIVRYLGVESTVNFLNIFLEYVPAGSISSLVSKHFKVFHESIVRIYTKQILLGLQYLHQNDILHRDIKAANILLDNNGIVKLADFGHSLSIKDIDKSKQGLKGTPLWMAPEVIKYNDYSRQSDIWSVGCTIIEMVTGKPPYPEYSRLTQIEIMQRIGSAEKAPQIPPELTNMGKMFLKRCFEIDPKKRATCEELLSMGFILKQLDEQDIPFREEQISPNTEVNSSIWESRYVSNEEVVDENRVPDTVLDTLRSIDRQIQNIQESNKSIISSKPHVILKEDGMKRLIKEKATVTHKMEKSLSNSLNSSFKRE